MSVPELLPESRDLFKVAKAEGPSAASRQKIWTDVEAATAAAGATALAAARHSVKPLSGLIAGGKAGGVVTLLVAMASAGAAVGTGVSLSNAMSAPQDRPLQYAHRAMTIDKSLNHVPVRLTTEASAASKAFDEAALADEAAQPQLVADRRTTKAVSKSAEGALDRAGESHGPAEAEDSLVQESLLVAEARGAVANGDPSRALSILSAVDKLPERKLVPEALSLKARALTALGRTDEAAACLTELRRVYPEHALAR